MGGGILKSLAELLHKIAKKLGEIGIIQKFFRFFPVVKTDTPVISLIVLLLNVFLPGIGAIIAGIINFKSDKGKLCVVFGILELLTCSLFFIGYICSWIHGSLLFMKAYGKSI